MDKYNTLSTTEKKIVKFAVNESVFYEKEIKLVLKRTKLFAYKYPKMLIFVLCVILAYQLFQNNTFSNILTNLGYMNYLGAFIGGILFSFGFTAPFATVILLKLVPDNIFIAALIGGCGATISNLLIFKFIKISFESEFKRLKKEKPFLFIRQLESRFNPKIIHYLTFAFAGILFASPLPDEAAVMILASISKINIKALAVISFIFTSLGILILLLI